MEIRALMSDLVHSTIRMYSTLDKRCWFSRNRLTYIGNKLVVAKGERGESGMDKEFGVSGCKLLRLEWINRSFCCGSVVNKPDWPCSVG